MRRFFIMRYNIFAAYIYFSIIMKRIPAILIPLLLFFANCSPPSAKLANSFDPDIVLVNIENGDRTFIGKVLQKLDSLKPLIIGIDVTFQGKKPQQDSVLIAALQKIKNDILVYSVNKDGLVNGSDSVFVASVHDQGNLYYEQRLGLITTIIPLRKVNDVVHESIAVKIIKNWKPDFVSQIGVDEKIDINYTRTLEKFHCLDGSFLLTTNIDDFDFGNNVFLVGYTGPENEDKHFTPLRFIDNKKYKNDEPDTYGLVIIANEMRTILEYKKHH